MTVKTVLAPNAPWPWPTAPEPEKPKAKRVPPPPKDPSKQVKTDKRFKQWAINNGVRNI